VLRYVITLGFEEYDMKAHPPQSQPENILTEIVNLTEMATFPLNLRIPRLTPQYRKQSKLQKLNVLQILSPLSRTKIQQLLFPLSVDPGNARLLPIPTMEETNGQKKGGTPWDLL
jgi:hypothetical protein